MLNIGIAVDDILTSDPTVAGIVGNNIHPNAVKEAGASGDNITYPVIIYGRSSIEIEYSKDCDPIDSVNVAVDIWDKSYRTAIELATAVRTALEGLHGTYSGIYIRDSILISATESFDLTGYYGQTLNFEIR